jgi:hypothetical protein
MIEVFDGSGGLNTASVDDIGFDGGTERLLYNFQKKMMNQSILFKIV